MIVRHIIAILAAAGVLAGCSHIGAGGAGSKHAWTIPGEFRWADGEDVDNLNPLLSTETLVNDLSAFTMGYFFKFDDRDRPVPDLCLEVPTQANHLISADGKTMIFRLRHGVVWHDGAPFTSADVAFTIKLILDPKTNVLTRDGWDRIASVETPDAYTVRLHLKKPYAPFIDRFFTPVGNPAILPQHLLAGKDINKAAYNALPVGLGPFRYVRWSRGNEVVMERFDRWWGGKPKLGRVVFKVVPDSNTVASELRTHEIDAFVRVPASQWVDVAAIADTKTVRHPLNAYGHLDFNLRNPILADVRVRRALVYAFDKVTIWRKVYRENGWVDWTPLARSSWAYDARAPRYAYNLQRAAALLDSAGWRMGPDGVRHSGQTALRLTLAGTVGNPGLDATVLVMQSAYKQIGVALDYKRYQTNQMFASYAAGGIVANRKYDLAIYAWSLAPDPSLKNLIACSSISPNGQNYMAYCNPRVDELLAQADGRYDRASRKRTLIEVQELLGRDVPFTVVTLRAGNVTYNDDLRGFNPGPSMDFWNPQDLSI